MRGGWVLGGEVVERGPGDEHGEVLVVGGEDVGFVGFGVGGSGDGEDGPGVAEQVME